MLGVVAPMAVEFRPVEVNDATAAEEAYRAMLLVLYIAKSLEADPAKRPTLVI